MSYGKTTDDSLSSLTNLSRASRGAVMASSGGDATALATPPSPTKVRSPSSHSRVRPDLRTRAVLPL